LGHGKERGKKNVAKFFDEKPSDTPSKNRQKRKKKGKKRSYTRKTKKG